MLIILAQDGTAIKPSVASAIQNGVPVIAYDRLIEDPDALYITFDNVEVGQAAGAERVQGRAEGQLHHHQGQQGRRQRRLPARPGYEEVIGAAVKSGDIKIVGETYTDNWDPSKAQTEMEQFLTANNNNVQAVLSENDGMAGGVVAALTAQGLAGKVPVSGQDGDQAALNRVAPRHPDGRRLEGRPPARQDGRRGGHPARARTRTSPRSPAPSRSRRPGGNTLSSILLTPQPITKDNLNVVIDAGWTTKDNVCKGVTAGSVPVCG